MKAFGPAEREAFPRAKRALTSAPVLKYPDFTREFIVHTDASEAGVENFSLNAHAKVAPIPIVT